MTVLGYFKKLYSLDTLDARFTTSSTTPPPAASSKSLEKINGEANGTQQEQDRREGKRSVAAQAKPPLWNTPEFYLYYLVIATFLPLMFKSVYDVSQPSHPNYKNFAHLLSPGWIPGRLVDNSDGQYASFRDNLPYMFVLVFAHPLLRRAYSALVPASGIPVGSLSPKVIAAEAHFEQRVTFDRYFAIVFLIALHGFSSVKVLLILYINFCIAHRMPRSYIPTVTWIFNLAILFGNELCHGYSMARLADFFLPAGSDHTGKNWGSYLDDFGGLIPHWEVLFKITILRMISYNMDYYWSLGHGGSSPIEKKQLDRAALSERDRVSLPAEPQHYNFRTYLSYTLYSPLYLAGPILTYNDYVSQCHYPPAQLTRARVVNYGIRFLMCLLCMEVIQHFLYAVAISKDTPDWFVYTPFQLSMLGYFNLHHIWLKLLIPWRFFRLWALADGLDPPENMVRCMSDNYSAAAFWRSWHRSFNRWVVRYVYVPIAKGTAAATKGKFGPLFAGLNFIAVFSFVAVWHDINLRLLIWGWMVVFFIAPEVIATLAFPKQKWENRPTTYRMLCGIGACGNILMMMAANLVGFAVGVDGLKSIIEGIVGSVGGILYLLVACFALFVGSQVMFEHREEEHRHGIDLRC